LEIDSEQQKVHIRRLLLKGLLTQAYCLVSFPR